MATRGILYNALIRTCNNYIVIIYAEHQFNISQLFLPYAFVFQILFLNSFTFLSKNYSFFANPAEYWFLGTLTEFGLYCLLFHFEALASFCFFYKFIKLKPEILVSMYLNYLTAGPPGFLNLPQRIFPPMITERWWMKSMSVMVLTMQSFPHHLFLIELSNTLILFLSDCYLLSVTRMETSGQIFCLFSN